MATVPSNHATIRAALEFHRRWAQEQHEDSADPYYVEMMAEIDAALDTLAAGQEWVPVPSGTYYTYHRDGFISYSPESRQLSVSQIKKRMAIFVGTLPEGWELRRAKQETPTNAK